MTELERHAIRKCIENNRSPIAPGQTFTEDEGGGWSIGSPTGIYAKGPALLDSEEYKAGYLYASENFTRLLEFVMRASPADLRKFAGRPKKRT